MIKLITSKTKSWFVTEEQSECVKKSIAKNNNPIFTAQELCVCEIKNVIESIVKKTKHGAAEKTRRCTEGKQEKRKGKRIYEQAQYNLRSRLHILLYLGAH